MDFTSDQQSDKLYRNIALVRSLSLQWSIYYEGYDAPLDVRGKFAYIFLHLKVSFLGFGTTIPALQRSEDIKIGECHL